MVPNGHLERAGEAPLLRYASVLDKICCQMRPRLVIDDISWTACAIVQADCRRNGQTGKKSSWRALRIETEAGDTPTRSLGE